VNKEFEFTEEIEGPNSEGSGISVDDFVAFLPTGSFVFMPCREMWSGHSVNIKLGKIAVLDKHGQPTKRLQLASKWLMLNRGVTQMIWVPGYPPLIPDKIIVDGGWIDRKDVTCLNLYRPPRLKLGDATKAGPWLEHMRRIYDADDAAHVLKWLAHRVQLPQEKINHALVLAGPQGIGKDSLLEPIKHAIGPWNFREISPDQLLGQFNSFAKSVLLRVNEAHDLGEADRLNRFAFYERCKIYTATPPDVLRINEKHLREYYAFNVLGFLITTNHKTDGIYLPEDDRRHYVAWSDVQKEDFPSGYWVELWDWYAGGGFGHVAAHLAKLDLSAFDAKAPPPKTAAFWEIVAVNQAPEDAQLADLLDKLERPSAVTLAQLTMKASGELAEWLTDRKYRRAIPHRLERSEYVPVRNPTAKDGMWKLQGARQAIYANAALTGTERLGAARKLVSDLGQ
jgi:Family of unknown function (DUF5906)